MPAPPPAPVAQMAAAMPLAATALAAVALPCSLLRCARANLLGGSWFLCLLCLLWPSEQRPELRHATARAQLRSRFRNACARRNLPETPSPHVMLNDGSTAGRCDLAERATQVRLLGVRGGFSSHRQCQLGHVFRRPRPSRLGSPIHQPHMTGN